MNLLQGDKRGSGDRSSAVEFRASALSPGGDLGTKTPKAGDTR